MSEPIVAAPEHSNAIDGQDDGTELSRRGSSINAVATIAAACVGPILYMVYVSHYAVNSFFFDDYSTFIAMHLFLHGHLPFSQLWIQYTEGRQVTSNFVLMLSARVDRADVRSILLFNGVIFIATYGIVLALFQKYLRSRLTPVPVLLVGIVWFSIGDVGNSLFAYQLSLYFVLLFVFVMLFALLYPVRHRNFWFAVAVVAAMASSLSFLDGFLAWPLGAVCILWGHAHSRRMRLEVGIWIATLVAISAAYFYGYQSSGCVISQCSPGNSLSQPFTMLRVVLALIGGVLPGGYFGDKIHNPLRFELVGAVLLVVAVFILIQSWLHRDDRERMPLPMLMVLFALSWDVLVALGRTGLGVNYIAGINRYMMPNLILLTAIIIYAWSHRPSTLQAGSDGAGAYFTRWLPLSLVVIFVIVQVVWSTSFGLVNARAARQMFVTEAQLWVNLDRVPVQDRACEVEQVLNQGFFPGGPPQLPAKDHLGEFSPNSFRYFRSLGPPPLSPQCEH